MSTASPQKKQSQMKEQIAIYLRKKDYYDILGVPKTCQQAQIKKAYKKLALRFHPDKNSIEGSKQVFKKVSNAYSNLIDPQKRATYDRYGPQQDRQPQYRPQRQYRQGYSQQDQFEQIFRAFFGGAPAQRHYRNNGFQHFSFNFGGPQQNNQQNQGFSLLYIFLFFIALYILPALFSSGQQNLYSLNPTTSYRFKQETSLLRNPYFVKQDYFAKNKNGQYTKNLQAAVDQQFVTRYKKQCNNLSSPYYSSVNAATKASWRQSCTKFNQFNRKYPAYVRNLLYGY